MVPSFECLILLIKTFRDRLQSKLEYSLLAFERKVTEQASYTSQQLSEGGWQGGTEETMPFGSGSMKATTFTNGVQQAAA